MQKIIDNKKIIALIVAVMMIVGSLVPLTVSAEAPITIDTTLMSVTDDPGSYQGDADVAFAIDEDNQKLVLQFYGRDEGTWVPKIGFSKYTIFSYFGQTIKTNDNLKIKINGIELDADAEMASDKYFNLTMTYPDYSSPIPEYTLTIKPGGVVDPEFFATNKLEISEVKASAYDPVVVGNYDGAEPDPVIRPAKTIHPADPLDISKTNMNTNDFLLIIDGDLDTRWINSWREVTYCYDGGEPTLLRRAGTTTINKNGIASLTKPIESGGAAQVGAARVNKNHPTLGNKFAFAVVKGIFSSVPVGEERQYTFTIKAEGYEDTVVTQIVKNPEEVLEVSVENETKYNYTLEDLQKMWEDEGSKEYTYSSYNTFPSFETENFYGPTVEAVLSASNIDIATLADNDVIEFTANDGYKAKITVKDFKEKRYYFPNGKSPDDARFKGTTAAQLEGKVEVPYIVSLKGGEDDLRNIFGQRDPQEEMKNDWNQSLAKITVYKGTATEFNGVTPTIENGATVKEGDKLFFDVSYSGWQGGSRKFAGVYYTVSTDGTEPADPTLSDVLYNFADYQLPDYTNPEDWGLLNYYEFTDAETTIIKFMAYARGYSEPVVQTLRYENAGEEELTCELTSSEGNDLKVKKHTTLTAEVTNGAVEDYTYKFIVYNKTTNQWYKLRDFEASNTFDWYTGPAGEKTLFVDVKDVEGNVERFQLDVDVTESDLAVKSFTISPEGVLPTKSQATLTAEAEKGVAPYEYKFIVYNETTQQWYKLKDFGSESTFDWYTGPEGSKKLYVDVKDADGTVVRQELAVTVTEAGAVQLDNAA